MTLGTVAYSEEIKCRFCGHVFSGYYAVLSNGQGKTVCPKCSTDIVETLPERSVHQIPPASYESPSHPRVHHIHYQDLYDKPKSHPRFHFMDIVRVAYSPEKALMKLYLTSNLQRAMAIVIVFSMVLVAVSVLVSVDMAEVIGYDAGDAIQFAGHVFFAWVISILAFMVLSLSASFISKGVFGGRGDRSATITLIGYCFPIYVLVSFILFIILEFGFESVGFVPLDEWTSEELNRVTAGVVLLFVAALIGMIWLLIITSRAISVANDVSLGEWTLTAILSASAAGLVYLVVESVMSLPLVLGF